MSLKKTNIRPVITEVKNHKSVSIIDLDNGIEEEYARAARNVNNTILMKYKHKFDQEMDTKDLERTLERIIECEGGSEAIANRINSCASS